MTLLWLHAGLPFHLLPYTLASVGHPHREETREKDKLQEKQQVVYQPKNAFLWLYKGAIGRVFIVLKNKTIMFCNSW